MKKIYDIITNNEIKIFYLISSFCFILFVHYNKLYHYFGHHSFSPNFVDWEFIRGFAKCNIENKNRFYDLSCDMLERRVVYPPTWNYTPKIIYYLNANFIFILSIISIFIVAAKFIKIKKISHGVLIFLIFSSPYFLYGYHRLNIDIILLPILFFSVYFFVTKKKIFSSGIIIFCSFLKIYPVALYALYFKEKKLNFLILIGISILFLSFILFFHFDEVLLMLENSDMAGGPGNGTFSGNNLFFFISKIFINNPSEQNLTYIFLNIVLLIIIYLILPNHNLQDHSVKNLENLFFVSGFLILIFSFIISYNINYRLMYILFFLPLFFSDNFINNKHNKKLSLIFLILFLLKGHANTLLGNISLLEYFGLIQTNIGSLFKSGTTYSFYLNLIDSVVQWILIALVLKIFKQNNFKKIIS